MMQLLYGLAETLTLWLTDKSSLLKVKSYIYNVREDYVSQFWKLQMETTYEEALVPIKAKRN